VWIQDLSHQEWGLKKYSHFYQEREFNMSRHYFTKSVHYISGAIITDKKDS